MSATLSRRAALLAFAAAMALWGPSLSPVGGTQSVQAASCEGDECQPPEAAPDDPTPGTAVVRGPGDPPVRFEKSHHKKPHKGKSKKKNSNKNHSNKKGGRR